MFVLLSLDLGHLSDIFGNEQPCSFPNYSLIYDFSITWKGWLTQCFMHFINVFCFLFSYFHCDFFYILTIMFLWTYILMSDIRGWIAYILNESTFWLCFMDILVLMIPCLKYIGGIISLYLTLFFSLVQGKNKKKKTGKYIIHAWILSLTDSYKII